MEKVEVFISIEAFLYLDDLIEVLYENEYFGFLDAAEDYNANIYGFIYTKY